ncbi:MAG: hypothetical protein ACI36Y_01560 [Coriobacteriales bacterium]
MSSFHRIAFIAAFALICCSAGANAALSQLAPGVFSADNYLSGGNHPAVSLDELKEDPAAVLTDREFADGARDLVEKGFGSFVPFHDSLLLASAGLQRQGIATANLAAGFECYHTYYGSGYVELPQQGAVSYIPEEKGEGFWRHLKKFAKGLAKKAKQHPETTFVMYLVPGKSTPGASPLYEYMSNLATPQEVMAVLEEQLAGIDNLLLLTDSYASTEDYYANFFKTDHHWNILGAVQARNTIGAELGWEPLGTATAPIAGFEDYRSIGTNARAGLDPIGEEVFDLDYDFSQLTIKYASGKVADGNDHTRFTEYSAPDKPYVFHARYFNTVKQVATFTNSSPGAQGKALLVSDSYGGAISRPLALQFKKLYRSNDLFNESKNRSFEETFAKDDYSTVFFVAHTTDLTTAMVHSRHYFD